MDAAYQEVMELQSGIAGRVAVGSVLTPSARLLPDGLGHVFGVQQAAIQLRRRDVAHHVPAKDRAAIVQQHAIRLAALNQHLDHVGAGLEFAALVLDQLAERHHRLRVAAFDHRHSDRLERERDDLEHHCGQGAFRAQTGMQHPRRQQGPEQFGPYLGL